jgi:hypothetical protein
MNDNNTIALRGNITNYETNEYNGNLRVYLTEIISTTWKGDQPYRFAFLEFIINEATILQAEKTAQFTKSYDISGLDPDNLMIFAVLSNADQHEKFSQPPDKNPYVAYYIDAVATSTVVEAGNLPPEVGIQSPSIKYFHMLGNPKRKTLFGQTILIGRTTISVSATDDSEVETVEIYIDNKLSVTITEEPYEWKWHQLKIGKHTITVKVRDNEGKTANATMDVFVIMKWPSLISRMIQP